MRRRVVLWWFILTVAASPAAAQTWARKMFKETDHDFGHVARGSLAEYAFELQNIYLEDVHIAGVRSNCGCTIPRVQNETLKTYEKGAIIARINTPAFLGRKGATLTVTFDKPYRAEVQLQVRVNIRGDVVFEPGSVQFGSVEQNRPAETTVAVSYSGRDDWRILDARCANPHLTALPVERRRGGGQVVYDLIVRLDADAPAGYLGDPIVLTTSDRHAAQVSLAVEGRVLSSISVSPGSLFLGVVEPGRQVTRPIVVKGNQPFRVVAVRSEDGRFRFDVPVQAEPKTVHVIPVTFAAGQEEGKVVEEIVVETDLDGAASELRAYAVIAAAKS
jgi:hypothetical protein